MSLSRSSLVLGSAAIAVLALSSALSGPARSEAVPAPAGPATVVAPERLAGSPDPLFPELPEPELPLTIVEGQPAGELGPAATGTSTDALGLVSWVDVQRGVSLGVDRVAVWVCEVPDDTTDEVYRSLARFGPLAAVPDPHRIADWADRHVSPWFTESSRGRYQVDFTGVGRIRLRAGEGREACRDRAIAATAAPFTNVLAVDDSQYGGGFAGPGYLFRQGDVIGGATLATAASVFGRGAYVGGRSLIDHPNPAVVIHEIGHTLHWPHSYWDLPCEYDNRVDLMSGSPGGAASWCRSGGASWVCRAQHTLAVNRYASGWIDPDQVVVHDGSPVRVALSAPARGGTELLVLPGDDPATYTTIEARPALGADVALAEPGVALHVVDQRPSACESSWFGGACFGLGRRQSQVLGPEHAWNHVIDVGERIVLGDLAVHVESATADGYVVWVGPLDQAPAPLPFTDVPARAFFTTAVTWAAEHGVTTGVGGGNRFEPGAAVTRGQMVTFLWRMMDRPGGHRAHGFVDVGGRTFYEEALRWARSEGVTTGVGGRPVFAPDGTVTRGQMVTFLWRIAGSPTSSHRTGFVDVDAGTFYGDAVRWAAEHGITTGVGGGVEFQPDVPVTRGETATFLHRLANRPDAWSASVERPSTCR